MKQSLLPEMQAAKRAAGAQLRLSLVAKLVHPHQVAARAVHHHLLPAGPVKQIQRGAY